MGKDASKLTVDQIKAVIHKVYPTAPHRKGGEKKKDFITRLHHLILANEQVLDIEIDATRRAQAQPMPLVAADATGSPEFDTDVAAQEAAIETEMRELVGTYVDDDDEDDDMDNGSTDNHMEVDNEKNDEVTQPPPASPERRRLKRRRRKEPHE